MPTLQETIARQSLGTQSNLLVSTLDAVRKRTIRMGLVSIYGSKNIGYRAISGALRQAGIHVESIFFKDLIGSESPFPTEAEYDLLINLLRDLRVNFVGLSIISSSCDKFAREITRRVHDQLGVPVILGGPHPSLMPAEILEYGDMVCRGEGHESIVNLVRRMEQGEIDPDVEGIWKKRDGQIIKSDPDSLLDINLMPFPDVQRDHKYFIENGRLIAEDPFHLHPDIYSTITSKGCQFHCTFCETNMFEEGLRLRKAGDIRQMSPDRVIAELKNALNTGADVRMVEFIDDEFSYNEEWVAEWSEKYKKEINLPFWCMFHPHSVNGNIIKMLRHAGLYFVSMGLQSGSEKIRRKILGRPENDDDFRQSLSLIHSVGVIPKVDVMFDNPYDTDEEKRNAIEFFLSLQRPFHPRMVSLCYFPKTKLTERALRDGFITPDQVEGPAQKAFTQLVLSPDYPRPKKELFYILLTSLTGCRFFPKSFIRWLMNNETYFMEKPKLMLFFAHVAHMAGVVEKGWQLLMRGGLTLSLMRNYVKYLFKVSA
jgi:radical SAM superfamily enzyme YgiQ (UPF0313 family)